MFYIFGENRMTWKLGHMKISGFMMMAMEYTRKLLVRQVVQWFILTKKE